MLLVLAGNSLYFVSRAIYLVLNLSVTLSRNLDLHREVLHFDSFDAAGNKPQTRSFANYSRVEINPAYCEHERVGTIFEGEVLDCESINAVGVN